MTAALTNTKFNNIGEMLSKARNSAEKFEAGFDKSGADFEKVFGKTVDKIRDNNNEINRIKNNDKNAANYHKKDVLETSLKAESPNTQDLDVKKTLVSDNKKTDDSLNEKTQADETIQNWAEFKEKLSEISAEANVETSLDLTLAKDINEIISQLKEAVEDTAEAIEDIENAIVLPLEGSENNVETVLIVEEQDAETQSEAGNQKEAQIPFEQVLAFYDKSAKSDISKSELNFVNKEAIDIDSNTNETFEMFENLESVVEDTSSQKNVEKDSASDLESMIDEEILKDLNIESMQAETDTTGGEAFMPRQAPEEVAVKAMISKDVEVFDMKLEASQSTQTAQVIQQVPPKSVEINPSRILEQITRQLDGLQNGSKVNIVLNPESLGKVNIQLLSSKEGIMAQLTVTTQEAKDVLMKGLDALKESLVAHGVNADNISIKVADSQKTEYNEDWTEQESSRGGNKGQKEPDKEEKDKGLFEKMMAQTLKDENGNV